MDEELSKLIISECEKIMSQGKGDGKLEITFQNKKVTLIKPTPYIIPGKVWQLYL